MSKNRLNKNIRVGIRHVLRLKQGGKCCYCQCEMIVWGKPTTRGNSLPLNAETLEHLRRVEDGGTNHPDNLALSCHECNVGRGTIDWLTYKTLKNGEFEVAV